MTAVVPPAATIRTVPYIGPRPFTRDDVRLGFELYGRDWEIDQLTDLLIGKRIVLLHAPSGAGKTSLIQAKLLPRLESEEFDVLPVIRVGLEPDELPAGANRYLLSTLRSLDAVLPRELWSGETNAPIPDLASILDRQRDADSKPQLLIFDQFEEILTADPTDRPGKEAFFAQLGTALRNRDRWALFAMREDYVAALEPYVWALPTRLATTFRLDFLGTEAAADAIQQPAQAQADVSFTKGAVKQLVDDLRRVRVQRADGTTEEPLGPYVEPVQLQVVCRRLWERLPPDVREITEADLGEAGQVDTALGDYYAEQVKVAAEATGIGERRIRDWFEDRLIARQGIRGQVLKGEEESDGLSNRAIRRLENAHLVRAEERRGAAWYELAHDRLIGPIQADNARWREENLNLFQSGAALWVGQGRPSSLLLGGDDLTKAESWASQHRDELVEAERAYLAASREAQENAERERLMARRMGFLAVGATIIAIIAVVSLIYALVQRDRAEEMSQLARARQLAQYVARYRESRLDLALLLGLESTRGASGIELTRGLLPNVVVDPHLIGFMSGHSDWVRSLAFSPDGKRLASSSSDRTILLWHGREAIPLTAPLAGHSDRVFTVVFSPDGNTLASASGDGAVMLWDVTADQPGGRTIGRHTGGAFAVAFSPDGTKLASGGADRTVRVWDVQSGGRPLVSDAVHTDSIYRVAFSPDGALIASGGRDARVVLWNASSLESVGVLADERQDAVYGMAFSPDGTLLVTGASDYAINVWNVEQRSRLGEPLTEHKGSVFDVVFNKDGTRLASAGADKRVLLWDRSGDQLRLSETRLTGFRDKVYSVAFSPKDDELVSGNASGMIARWDLLGEPALGAPLSALYSSDVYDVAFSPKDDTLLAWATALDVNLVRDIEANLDPVVLEAPDDGNLNAIAFNSEGTLLAAGGTKTGDGARGHVALWDVASGQPADPPGFDLPQAAESLAFSSDGALLAVGGCSRSARTSECTDGDVRIWDVRSRQLLDPPLLGHRGWVWSVAFSPDGTLLASAGEDGTILLWDVATRTLLDTLPDGHKERIFTLAFSPDGRLLASGSNDSNIILWDVHQRRAIEPISSEHTAGVTHVAFNRDGTMLASGSIDGTIVLWDTMSRLPLGQLPPEHRGRITSLAFSRDDGMLVSGGAGAGAEKVIRWDISGDHLRARACEVAGRNLTDAEWRLYVRTDSPQPSCPHPLVLQALQQAHSGDRAAAEATFEQVVRSASGLDDFRLLSRICWHGSLHGFPSTVMPACERAYERAPRWLKDWTRDNRGLAWALSGDRENAAADFRAFVAWARKTPLEGINEELIARRERWIEALEAGQNPFDAEMLRALRIE